MNKYTEGFQSQLPNLNTDYLLLDSEQVDFDSYLDADHLSSMVEIQKGVSTTYVNQEFKNYIKHMLNKGAKVMGFSLQGPYY